MSLPITSNRLFFSDETPRPLGRITLAGTLHRSNGTSARKLRVLGRYALVVVCEGSGFYNDTNGIKTKVAAGDAIVVFPEIPHAYGPRPPKARGGIWDEIYLCFEGPIFDLWRSEGLLDATQPVRPLSQWRSHVQTLFSLTEAPRPSLISEHNAQLQQLLSVLAALSPASAARTSQIEPQWLLKSRAFLESHLDRSFSGQETAEVAGLSYESFRKAFVEHTGLSPARYRTQKRLEAARILLAGGQMTQGAIARSLGFRDEAHLSRRFREIYGCGPRALLKHNSDLKNKGSAFSTENFSEKAEP